MESSIDPDDVVVAELDVVFSNELASLQSQLVMLQQPLRPNWRAYDTGCPGSSAKFKPNARRLELSLPLDTQSENYQVTEDEHKRIKTVDLRSTVVEDPVSSYAAGVIKGNQLVLVPLDFTLQLRPSMAYLQSTPEPPGKHGKAEAAEESDEEEAAGEELTAVEVTVKRRETERQQQMRLKSFSYMQQEEQQEAWVPLNVIPSDSAAADNLWDKLLEPEVDAEQQQQQQQQQGGRPTPKPLSRAEYLNAFVPSAAGCSEYARGVPQGLGSFGAASGAGTSAAAAGGARGAGAGSSGSGLPNGASPSPSPAPEGSDAGAVVLPDGMRKAVRPFIKSLFKRYTVCSMANVRQWLQQQGDQQTVAAAALDDQLLNGLLMGSGYVQQLRRVYIAKEGPHSDAQPLRQVALEVLASKPQIRKGDVVKRAKEQGIPATDNMFAKVSKELCKNNGSYWVLKTGADM